ncbi:MAG: M1 family peptidase, partial [Gemmatimonadetes bacterium]|nr:M1 family metallopeptidase [Gemmatimonadota bacterium]NIQ60246.1 M1 family metallopeptidase [Gemmatimonadota bacterium]NIU80461.1 M1 family peptidase [Gammaproteobacteria bacterium]NIX48792.1 M1 family peptidase [Gemmatimonadota bacterium]NIY13248.1 M1 family peptidase [Gemmatimonadota bacterium]
EYLRAVERGTRSPDGDPGPEYWQQWADYVIEARVDEDAKTLTGSETIRYRNNAPGELPVLVLNLLQNYHAEGVERVRPAEVTGGMAIERVAVNGRELGATTSRDTPGWAVDGTLMYVV